MILKILVYLSEDKDPGAESFSMTYLDLASQRQIAQMIAQEEEIQKNLLIKNSFAYLNLCLQQVANSSTVTSHFKKHILNKLLKDSLQPQSLIIFMAHFKVDKNYSHEEFLNTLFFADQTRKIVSEPKEQAQTVKVTS